MRQYFHRVFTIGLIIIASLIATPLLGNSEAHAADLFDGNWYLRDNGGTGVSEGYFTNGGYNDTLTTNRSDCPQTKGCSVLPNNNYATEALDSNYFHGGNSSTAASVQRAKQLVATLKAYYGTGTTGSSDAAWRAAGSSFIVNTMLGYNTDSPNKSRMVSAAMWADVETRLIDRAQNNRIDWNEDFGSEGKDTFIKKIYNNYDVVYNTFNQTRNGLVIYDNDGSVAYKIWYICANPVGTMDGIDAIPQDYNLEPSVSVDRTAGEPAETVVVTPRVNNNGSATSRATTWTISTMEYAPGVAVPTTSHVSTNGGVASPPDVNRTCDYFRAQAAKSCSIEAGNRGVGTYSVGSPSTQTQVSGDAWGPKSLVLGDYVAGTRVCYSLSVYSRNEATGTNQQWLYSAPVCVVIAKKPKVQVQGGDLSVGKRFASVTGALPLANVSTSNSVKNISGTSRTFGSWIEYGIFATGTISGAASASAYADPGLAGATRCGASVLSFANTRTGTGCTNTTTIGNYTSNQAIPDVAASFPIGAQSFGNNPTININADSPRGIYTATGNVSIRGGGPVQKGQSLILNAPNATVTITGNIELTNADFRSTAEIPQVVIIARNINIVGSVTQIDAWLIAKGTTMATNGKINTCSDVNETAPLTANVCTQQLVVNGPVMAQKLLLRRTAGSGTGASTGAPAEIFNLRADSYLWATAQASGNGRVQTVYTTELPPRL